MKKIIAVLIALLISINILSFNCIKASAVALPASVLTYLIEACYTILVGSGTVSQSDFNNMNTSEVFDTTSGFISENQVFPWVFPDLGTDINKFLIENNNIQQQVLRAFDFGAWVLEHTGALDTVSDFDMNGYGCVAIQYDSKNKYILNAFYGSEGQFYNLSSSSVTFTLPYSIGYTYFSSGAVASTSENSSVSSTYDFSGSRWVLYGNWVMKDGSAVPDGIVNSDSSPASIGTVDVDGTTYDVTGDGTVTIGDTTYTINDDGTVTINGDTYYPTYDVTPYDDTAIIDLLGDILNQIQVTEDDKAADLIDEAEIEVPIEIANSEFSSLTLPKTILTVFPFCIPVDFYNGIKLLSQPPKAPRFEVPFEIPEFGLFPGYKKMIVLDFSEYESAFYVVRWVTFALFMFGLCFITFKIVKGA